MRANKKNNYFYFTKKEKNGSIFLLLIISAFFSIPFLYAWLKKENVFNREKYSNEIERLNIKQKDSSNKNDYKKSYRPFIRNSNRSDYKKDPLRSSSSRGERFHFDPNQASAEEWLRLGVSEKTAATIQKYIAKGGQFRKAEDLKKIWGIPPNLLEELIPFVRIASNPAQFESNVSYKKTEREFSNSNNPKPIDINDADSMSWLALPAIGPALTNRILRYKEKLGGFHSAAQIREVYGITDSSFEIISPYLQTGEKEIKKININTASLDELKLHPYIRYRLANAIVEYRNQHGAYSSVAGLKKIMLITDEVLMKIAPYLVVQ